VGVSSRPGEAPGVTVTCGIKVAVTVRVGVTSTVAVAVITAVRVAVRVGVDVGGRSVAVAVGVGGRMTSVGVAVGAAAMKGSSNGNGTIVKTTYTTTAARATPARLPMSFHGILLRNSSSPQ
jgi:hypothetical protein